MHFPSTTATACVANFAFASADPRRANIAFPCESGFTCEWIKPTNGIGSDLAHCIPALSVG